MQWPVVAGVVALPSPGQTFLPLDSAPVAVSPRRTMAVVPVELQGDKTVN